MFAKQYARVREYVGKKLSPVHSGIMVGTGVIFLALFAFVPSLVFSASSNSTLANVPVGTAHYLGQYNPAPLAGCDQYSGHITDYSRFSYDSVNNQMLMFGGGHASTPRDDVDVLNLNSGSSLTWNSAYASTPAASMTLGNFDTTTGAWISTGYPRTRHTWDMMPFVPDTGELTLLYPTGSQSNCEFVPVDGDAFWAAHPGLGWAYNPTTKVWRTLAVDTTLWQKHDLERPAAEYDPVSHKVIILSRTGLFTYDPLSETGTKVKSISIGALGIAQNMVYFPPNGKMYYIEDTGVVYEVTLDRNNFANSTITQVTGITGTPPTDGETGWAYDSTNHIIGGGVNNGVFYAFDPVAKTWTATIMTSDAVGKVVGTQSFHALDYDPIDNVFVFISLPQGQTIDQQATWAYRYGNGLGGVATPVTDTTPPSVPTNLSATVVSQTQVNLSWSASTDDTAVTGYKVYRDGSLVASLTGTSYSDSGLSAGTTYSYTVAAYDASSNNSAQSSSTSATTQSSQTPPTVSFSSSLSTSVPGQAITLSWSSTGATSCVGTGFTAGSTSGSVSDSPLVTTTYSITCTGTGGSTSQSTTVTVVPAIQNVSVSGSDFSQVNDCSGVLDGQSCTATITFTPSTTGTRSGSFSFFDAEASTTQTISLTGVGTALAPTATLSTSASSISQGDSATLTWSSTNATSCVGSNFTAGATSGTASVSPSSTTTYSVTCTGPGGTASQSVMVSISASIPSQYVDGQAIIPAAALHIFDSPSTGTVWGYLSNLYMTVPWIHPGGDWKDANGTLQGSVSWATASVMNLGAEQALSFNVTSLVQNQLSGLTDSIPNRGWIIKNDSGGISEYIYTREYSDPTKRPNLHVVTNTGTYDLAPGADVSLSPSTSISSHDTETTIVMGAGSGYMGIYFDLSSISGSVTSATLALHTNATQYGGGTSVLGVYPVDLTETFTPIPVNTGLAANYTNDVGIENDPNVLFVEKFPDLSMENRGWWYAYFPTSERSIVGDTDPDDPNYKPLASGVKAYKMTIPTGQYGGEFGRWSFWSNLGYEPTEVYMRAYARIGTNFDSEGGKFPFGFDGTYLVRTSLNLLNPTQTITTNPVTGRAWIRPDAPAYAGNGGATSNGTNGWSFRGGFDAEDCPSGSTDCADQSPLVNAGYRALTYYSYWADQPDTKGSEFDWSNGLLGIVPKNHWFAIDEYVKLNTVNSDGSGNRDGILKAWIDGRLVFATTTIRERNWPGNAAGANNIKLDSVWLNLYHGGLDPAKSPMTVYLSDIVVANAFIGPGTFDTSLVLGHSNARNQGLAAAHSGPIGFIYSAIDSIGSFFSRIWHSITSFFHSIFAHFSGKSQLASVTASVSSLDFGSVTVGQSATRTITLTVGNGGGVVIDTPSSPSGPSDGSWLSSRSSSGGGGSISPILPAGGTGGDQSGIRFSRVLSYGAKGTDVSLLQTYLSSIGFLPEGSVSGFFGDATRSAVQKFQCSRKIACSKSDSTGYGVLGPKTIQAMTGQTDLSSSSASPSSSSSATPGTSTTKASVLALGSKGPAVTALQKKLITLKYLSTGSATGFFGKRTQTAVQKYQCAKGILCSGNASTGYGVFGPKTRKVMGI